MRPLFQRAGIVIVLLALPAAALAQSAPADFKGLATLIANIITAATGVVIALGVVYYMWGFVLALKERDSVKGWERLRTQAVWGVLILFVIFFIWAILRVLENTLFP